MSAESNPHAGLAGAIGPRSWRSRVPWVVLLGLIVLATRVPLLGSGYGSDPDAWRNIVAALHMRVVRHYVPSRVPGFPVFEVMLAALAPWGWVASNLAAALAELGALLAFARVLELRGTRNGRAAAAALAFGPALWVHATQTMDYAFGLAFFLGSYAALLALRPGLAGALLALASGCRPSYALALPAAAVFIGMRGATPVPRATAETGSRGGSLRSALARLLLGFAPVAFALFVPVARSREARGLMEHLARHVTHHVSWADLVPVLRGSVVFLFGKWAPGVLIVVVIIGLVARVRGFEVGSGVAAHAGSNAPTPDRAAAVFELLAGAAWVGFFLLIPYEQAYLLPVLPLLLITLARHLAPRAMIAFALAMALASLLSVEIAERRLIPGDLLLERAERRFDVEEARGWLALRPRTQTVIAVGRFGVHRLLALDARLVPTAAGWSAFSASGIALSARDRPLAFAERLTEAETDSLRRAGWIIRIASR